MLSGSARSRIFNFGVRTVRLDRTDITDAQGSGEFCFVVNGEKTFIRGTNWVPLDPFHSRIAQRKEAALDLLWETNCNMVRCWGGGVYEDYSFFDFCDRHGILVWQDFAMGCASYPQNDLFQQKIDTEVETVVKLFCQHPSIALWAGDNECDVATAYWEIANGEPNGNHYYLLELSCEGKTYHNHYVSGEIPLPVTQYETLLKKVNIL